MRYLRDRSVLSLVTGARRVLGVLALFLLTATPAAAELKLEEVRALYGPLGPRRESLELLPRDEVFFSCRAAGMTTDERGHIDAELSVRLVDSSGNVALEDKFPQQGLLTLGGGVTAISTNISFGAETAPGDYVLEVTVHDRLSGESASFERTLTCKEPGFGIARPRFFTDGEGKVPAPAGGVTGETLHFRLLAVGLDTRAETLHLTMQAETFDEENQPLMKSPLTAEIKSDDPNRIRQINMATFRGSMALHRPGTFRLRITVTDHLRGERAEYESPLTVTGP